MPRTPGTGGGRSLFRPSSPSTTTTSPGPKSPAIWPGWWPRPSGQVGGGRPMPPSPAAARIPILFPSSGPPLPAWLGAQARGRDGRCEEEKGGVAPAALQSRASGLCRWDEPDFFYWIAEVGVCCFFFPPPVTNFVTFLHEVVLICGIFLIVLHSFPPQS